MDWTLLVTVGVVGTFAGYLLGLLVRGAFVDGGGRGGGEEIPSPLSVGPDGSAIDFDLWELEMLGRQLTVDG
jgi:hypothetical protein